ALCRRLDVPRAVGDGVRFQHDKGYVTVAPEDSRNAVRVTGESRNSEFAQELCDFYLDQIKRLT
ncbi:MAG: hypothetical protein IJ189_00445, partial [Clostridia bacterium]|nr:hypothetical protein [Clostridia bacterium]